MADAKAGFLSKTMQKHAGRAKEKILQNLGKADKTTDDVFDEYVSYFTKQQNTAHRLNKELTNYIRCVRALQIASKNLFDLISEMYEPDWVGKDLVLVQAQNIDILWADFCHKLNDQVLLPLSTYLNQFSEVKKRMDKRCRKMIDYDCQRHSYQALLNNPKKRDEMKIAKAKEQLEEAKRTYETLNRELHDEIPALYDSRIPFLVSNLQTLYTAETIFHSETSKVTSELETIMERLARENQKGIYAVKRHALPASRSPSSPIKTENESRAYEEIDFMKKEKEAESQIITNGEIEKDSPLKSKMEYEPVDVGAQVEQVNGPGGGKEGAGKKLEELYDIPIGATTSDLPPNTLYRVRATYRYQCEDVDELSFEAGEVINVVEYEDPEEQEEGWLMGIKESTGQKGLFPANFTRPI